MTNREQSRPEMVEGAKGCGWLVAVLGAVLVHPARFLVLFGWGTIFGHIGGFMASGPPGAVQYGVEGGRNACFPPFFSNITSFGVLPLVVSGCGAGLAVLLLSAWRSKRH